MHLITYSYWKLGHLDYIMVPIMANYVNLYKIFPACIGHICKDDLSEGKVL